MVCSVYEEAQKAALEHKWLQSEKAGRDLGLAAVREWSTSYWLHFYRWRFVEHVQGKVFFKEFEDTTFGLVPRFQDSAHLLNKILDHVRGGAENLDLIQWGYENGQPMDQILGILEALDINSRRLPPPTD